MAPGTPRIELKLFLKETSFHRGRPRYVLTRSIDPGPSFTGDAEHQVRRHCQWVIHPNTMRDTRWRWNRERVPAWGGGDDTQRGGWTIKVEVRTTKEKCEAKTGKSSLPPHRLGLRRNQPLSLPSHSSNGRRKRPKRNAYAKKTLLILRSEPPPHAPSKMLPCELAMAKITMDGKMYPCRLDYPKRPCTSDDEIKATRAMPHPRPSACPSPHQSSPHRSAWGRKPSSPGRDPCPRGCSPWCTRGARHRTCTP